MTSITQHYAIRININDNLPYIIQNLQNLNNYTELLISPLEISMKNGKPHIHIYIKLIIPIQTDSIRKLLKTKEFQQFQRYIVVQEKSRHHDLVLHLIGIQFDF